MENNGKRFYLTIRGQEVEVSEEVYRAYIQPVRAERRRKQRAFRCKIKGKKGNLVRCQKDCRECPYALSGHNALGNKRIEVGDKWQGENNVLVAQNGKRLHPTTVRNWLDEALLLAGLPHCSVHSLRHTNISILIAAGVSPVAVASRVGHSKTSTTVNNQYGHTIINNIIKAVIF